MRIFVYGTSCGAGDLVDEALPAERIEAFIGREGGSSFLGRPVISLDELAQRDFDLLIVASRDADAVERECLRLGLDINKLLFLKNHMKLVDRNSCCDTARAVLGEKYVSRLAGSERLVSVPIRAEEDRIVGPGSDNDYVRLKTLEAICLRLSSVSGAAAEFGVYRGGFARWINGLLPRRTLYLFDTFEGFDEEEAYGYGAGFVSAHRNTAEERVRSILPHPERAVFRRGLFPQTAEGLEDERFALVSLDADLEESTLAALRFFIPRMSGGGYVLLHDWANPRLPGVKRALERYEAEYGVLAAVPICDVNGTLVISII